MSLPGFKASSARDRGRREGLKEKEEGKREKGIEIGRENVKQK